MEANGAVLKGETALPFVLDDFTARTLVVDVVPSPAITPWLEAARTRGLAIQAGPEMVAGQFRHVVAHLLGLSPEEIDPAILAEVQT